MKPDIHPKYEPCIIECSCGATYKTRSTGGSYKIAVCSACHPAYTGDTTRGLTLSAGQIDKFKRRYQKR